MFIGDVSARTVEEAARFRQLTYTCMDTWVTRQPETMAFPNRPCKEGVMTSLRFPTCWDGKNLDSPDHMAHMSYPETGTFESAGPCPATHPIRTSQVMFEVVWNTKEFHDMWPASGKNPFVWSFGDTTGYGTHADYVFGWKGDALQNVLDAPCVFTCKQPVAKMQSIESMNNCTQKPVINEDIDGCKFQNFCPTFPTEYYPQHLHLLTIYSQCLGLSALPGGYQAQYPHAST